MIDLVTYICITLLYAFFTQDLIGSAAATAVFYCIVRWAMASREKQKRAA